MQSGMRLHIVTGGPGAGKTTLVDALAAEGVATSPEVGRAVIREQIAAGGRALPWVDPRAYAEEMIEREIIAREVALASGLQVILDRGIPDVVGFLRVTGLAVPPHIDQAARRLRYHPRVLLAPWWDTIYTGDSERRQSPAVAEATEQMMRETYRDYGYELIELPRAPVTERVAFVRRELEQPCA